MYFNVYLLSLGLFSPSDGIDHPVVAVVDLSLRLLAESSNAARCCLGLSSPSDGIDHPVVAVVDLSLRLLAQSNNAARPTNIKSSN